MTAKKILSREINLPEGVIAEIDKGVIKLKGAKGEAKRKVEDVDASIKDSVISIKARRSGQTGKKLLGSYSAHIKNMILGVLEGHKYTLKICSGHFPMNVSVSGNKLFVKNFLGEKIPRVLEFDKNAKVIVESDLIYVESADKEIAGQTAASIEQLTRRPGYDTRVFQDGIYLINRDGKELK